jgi:ribosomal protein S5
VRHVAAQVAEAREPDQGVHVRPVDVDLAARLVHGGRDVHDGMRVVVVACDDAGNVDLGDLRAKIAAHADALAAWCRAPMTG